MLNTQQALVQRDQLKERLRGGVVVAFVVLQVDDADVVARRPRSPTAATSARNRRATLFSASSGYSWNQLIEVESAGNFLIKRFFTQ